MTSLVGRIASCTAAAALSTLPACAVLTDVDGPAGARVEVDPTIIQTIHYHAVDGQPHEPPSEVTTKPRDEIDCLHTNPRGCALSETIVATIHNTGSRTLQLLVPYCGGPLEIYGKGAWHPTRSSACILIAVPPIEIAPGETYRTGTDRWTAISVARLPTGTYRVRLPLHDGREDWLPDPMRTSPPFDFEPPEDFEPFVCPTESMVDLARRYAREELEKAADGSSERGFESTILRLESQIPGIGGIYFDPEAGRSVVWITDESRSDDAAAAVRELLGHPVQVKIGDYAFSALVGWSRVLLRYLGGIPGWHGLDADEGLNRVTIGIANELATAKVECLVSGLGMPVGMAYLEVRP